MGEWRSGEHRPRAHKELVFKSCLETCWFQERANLVQTGNADEAANDADDPASCAVPPRQRTITRPVRGRWLRPASNMEEPQGHYAECTSTMGPAGDWAQYCRQCLAHVHKDSVFEHVLRARMAATKASRRQNLSHSQLISNKKKKDPVRLSTTEIRFVIINNI